MSNDSKTQQKPDRPDLESARLGMVVKEGAPPVLGLSEDGPETKWGKNDASGPPTPQPRPIPQHLKKIVSFFSGIIADEGLLLDLCFEESMRIVQTNISAKTAGIDYFAADSTPVNYGQIAGPMCVELYRQALKAIDGRAEEFKKMVQEIEDDREKNAPGASKIIVVSKGSSGAP